jgi:hypothetical protein
MTGRLIKQRQLQSSASQLTQNGEEAVTEENVKDP